MRRLVEGHLTEVLLKALSPEYGAQVIACRKTLSELITLANQEATQNPLNPILASHVLKEEAHKRGTQPLLCVDPSGALVLEFQQEEVTPLDELRSRVQELGLDPTQFGRSKKKLRSVLQTAPKEAPKLEVSEPEPTKVETTGRETSKENSAVIAPKPEPEAPKPEAPKPEAPKPEAPKPEAPKPEAPKPEAPKPEAPKPETLVAADPKLGTSAQETLKDPKTLLGLLDIEESWDSAGPAIPVPSPAPLPKRKVPVDVPPKTLNGRSLSAIVANAAAEVDLDAILRNPPPALPPE